MKRLIVVLLLVAAPARAFADNESDAKALLDSWLAAQQGGDFAAYSALYAKKFVGIRRTPDGGEKKMKLKAWKADRKKMFKHTMEVAADKPVVKATKTGATVQFLQRWKSGKFADHGTKVLVLAYDKDGTTLQILKEELLSSTPGWEDDPSTTVDATALVAPITVKVLMEGINPNEGCTDVSYVLYLKDKKGHTVSREIGGGFIPTEDGMKTTEPVAPGDDPLYTMGAWCAGGEDDYQVVKSGDALVLRYKGLDEGEAPDMDWTTVATVQLPEGAKIKAK
jgi:hypothetical protein